ncbi:MAG: 1-acyl-sn-glycerol-3-phosphate acyltransferase [Bacteroidales bacterium]|nr:1-acyl-sn-glycerol-3-phosphate acyltransferase [Bacteroidales bacterium]
MDEKTHKLNFKPINIKDLFMDKNPGMARWIPGFVYRLLSRILRIDFMNDPILYNHGYKKDVDFAMASIEVFGVSLEVKGREHLPPEGRFIFVANHPLGGFDGMMIISELSKNYPHLKVLVNDLLTNVKNMDGIFVPINKHGAQAIENVRRIQAIFESDQQVMTFPAGLVSRRKKGIIRDTQWQKSIITKAVQTKRDIIPIHVTGRCSNFFYNLANTRKFLGIKANMEMFFLPNESYKHRNKHFVITFGKPIPYSTFDKRHTALEWAALIKDYTYTLVENPEGVFSEITT